MADEKQIPRSLEVEKEIEELEARNVKIGDELFKHAYSQFQYWEIVKHQLQVIERSLRREYNDKAINNAIDVIRGEIYSKREYSMRNLFMWGCLGTQEQRNAASALALREVLKQNYDMMHYLTPDGVFRSGYTEDNGVTNEHLKAHVDGLRTEVIKEVLADQERKGNSEEWYDKRRQGGMSIKDRVEQIEQLEMDLHQLQKELLLLVTTSPHERERGEGKWMAKKLKAKMDGRKHKAKKKEEKD